MTDTDSTGTESQRLEALREYGIDEAYADPGFDRITQLAASIFRVPIVLISLVEEARQRFVSRVGIETCETDRGPSFCAHALASRRILEVLDATLDPRFATSSLVLGPPFIRFYAGCPLVAASGHVLGTLCLIDTVPRAPLSVEEQSNLQDLAALVMDKLELRRLDLAWQANPTRFEKMAESSPDAIVCIDEHARITFWNRTAERLFGYPRHTMINASMGKLAPQHAVTALLTLAADQTSLSMGRTVELELLSASGVLIPVEVSASMWREEGRASFCAALRDVTDRRHNEQRLYRLAHIDGLTNLANRTLFRDRVDTTLNAGESGFLMMVDLDGFKNVNDGFGHAAGDAMLVTVAHRLQAVVPSTTTVARMGGDEFAAILPGDHDIATIGRIADDIIDLLSQPVMLEEEPVTIGASIGIAQFPDNGESFRALLSAADLALYEAKAYGKQCHRFYSSRLRDAAIAKQAYQTELPRALSEHEWVLFYQPIVRVADGALVGADAQLRWQHPKLGLLELDMFSFALQASPIAAQIGHWMLTEACNQLVVWRQTWPALRVRVAILDAQFRSDNLANQIIAFLREKNLPPSALELEITETILMRDDPQTEATLTALHAAGVLIALNNYGTGQASLNLLKSAPLTRLKIDPTFVQGMFDSKADAAIIRAILYLAGCLDMTVTAQGVDSQLQYERLLKKGCDEAQGRWVGLPTDAHTFLQNNQRSRRVFPANLELEAPQPGLAPET